MVEVAAAVHAAHDPLAVAEAADRGGRLPAGLASCAECTALHADLVAIAAAVPTAALPPRPRDFTLTPADAARLRPGGWRRLLAAIGSSRDVVTRPLAIGFTTLGLAGLLVATVPGALPGGGAASAPVGEGAGGSTQVEMPASEPSAAPMMLSAAPESAPSAAVESTDDGGVFSGIDTEEPAASPTGDVAARADASAAPEEMADLRDAASNTSTLVIVAGACLVIGLGLFSLRWSVRRLG